MAAFDGNGTYVRSYSWVQDASNNIDITASRFDTEMNGEAAALTLCVTRDGQGKMAADFLPATTGSYNLGSAASAWLAMTALQGTVGPPASGVGLTIKGLTGGATYALRVTGGSTAADRAIFIAGGVAAIDSCALFYNYNSTIPILELKADGSAAFGSPSGGIIPGSGNVNFQGIFINANPVYAGIPQNSQSGAYTTVLADANKHIYHPSADTTARTWTIDSNANVAYPIGTAITFDNDGSAGIITLAITSDTLVWLPSGGTGSRAIAPFGQATALKVTATRWHLTGVGIT